MNDLQKERLIRQHIAKPSLKKAGEIIQHLGAMQAQEFAMAKWAIGLRSQGLTEEKISKAYDKGEILRTHILRPTWHFVSPQDIGWMTELTGPHIKKLMAYMNRQLNLDAKLFNRCSDIIQRQLEEKNYQTREELQEELSRQKIKLNGQQMAHIAMNAEVEALICSGPMKGKQFTYALLSDRAPDLPKITREEALKNLAERYFYSRSPATVADFSTWSGLRIQDVKKAILILGKDLEKTEINGSEYYSSISIPPAPKKLSSDFLMPDYDEIGMGYKDRSALSHPDFRGKIAYNRMIVLDGLIIGTWKRTISREWIELELNYNVKIGLKDEKRVHEMSSKFAEFTGRKLKLI